MEYKSLLFALSVLALTGMSLSALDRIAPVILERDREGSVWHLHDLAERKIQEAGEIKWLATREERQRLLTEAAELLDRVRKLRPDVPYYEYYWRVTDYQAAMMSDHPDPERSREAIGRLIELWEEGGRESMKLAGILSYHYRRLEPDPRKAEEILNRILELDPANRQALDELIALHLEEGDIDSALPLLESKCEGDFDTASDREVLAEIHFRRGDWERVSDLLAVNLAGGAVTPESRLLFGVVEAVSDNQRQARDILRSYVGGTTAGSTLPSAPLDDVDGYPSSAFPALPYLVLEAGLPPEEQAP